MCTLTKSTKIAAAANYLIKVSQDDKLFASYFWWREYYTTIRNNWAKVRQIPNKAMTMTSIHF